RQPSSCLCHLVTPSPCHPVRKKGAIMLRFVVSNARERQQLEHGSGPIEFGRGPRRNNVPRCTIQDAYVSKDHVRIEEVPSGELRLENLSAKQPIVLATGAIAPGNWAMARPPLRLGVGDSFIDVELAIPDEIEPDSLRTVIQPLRTRAHDQVRDTI